MENIRYLEAFDKDQLSKLLARQEGRFELPFEVSREQFEDWRSDKEEIGGFEYDSSIERIIIKADGGPLQVGTVSALALWLCSLEHSGFSVSLGEEFDFEDYKRNVTDTKRPDCFIKKRGEEYPQVVFEVGYAATFEKLEEDAHRWLRGSNLVHRVFLVKIDKNDKYELFKETVVDNVENIPHGTYCGRRSCVYNLPAEQLQRYFERTDENIDELKKILDAWHKENFPILEDVSATLYVYGWSVSDTGDLEIGEIGREVYYPADNSQCSVAPSLEIATNDLFGDGKAGIGDNTTAVSLPIKDLRARIDQGIEEHIAKSIRKLVSGLRREYLHWKQSPPTTDIVVQTVRNTNESIPWNALLEETRPKPVFRDRANPILYHLQSLNTQSRLRALTEEVIIVTARNREAWRHSVLRPINKILS